MPVHRREFILSSAAAAAAQGVRGANDRLRVAVVGIRGRGQSHIDAFHQLAGENVEIAALCDAEQSVLEQRATAYERKSGRKVAQYGDMRRVLDDKSIDAVGFATPNHWHALCAVWACQAGKDVYVEKPGTHVFSEGHKIIEAAAKHKRIVQHGTQNRSSPAIVEGIQKLKEGVIGRVYMARGVAFKLRAPVGPMKTGKVPPGLNWDMWIGPAPMVPYSSNRHDRPAGQSWHMFWDYGNAELGNQGVHELDIIRWGLGLDQHPAKIACMGGKYVHPEDAYDAPQVQAVMYEYAGRDVLVSFETRSGFTNTEAGMGAEFPFLDHQNVVGVIFVGTEGYMIMPDYSSYHTFLGKQRKPGPSRTGAGDITDLPHFANFVKAVRSRKPENLAAPPRELHYSAALAHFANIALRTGRMLEFDAGAGRFKNDDEANRLLTKQYRAPYTMPDTV
jgi:predicted dehydrogenase